MRHTAKLVDLMNDDWDARNYEDVNLRFTPRRRLDSVLRLTRQVVGDRRDENLYAVPREAWPRRCAI